ncbi:conserved hypothetical protein [Ricinus communis]|uniref:DUF3741 domain-containing protein n=1 Tax=Ricinus communis TaxID=3988 RepID=B9R7T3_RICCO|nr:conserved hypothetical protein [Ricinus communis]
MDSSGNSSILGFLNQIGRQSVGMGNTETGTIDRHGPATNHLPTLSHLHIKEISKGAQKLNQILRACSNGLNFDRYSIEIGKELLKGAMDLEESLRMLVNLQEASEYMISPQNKTRITLLDNDEDEDHGTVKTAENKQLARPMFSFDKPSRNSHYIQEVARSELKQRLMALTYKSDTADFVHDAYNLSTSNSACHRRSASYSPNMKNPVAFSEQKNPLGSSISKPEKGRIPNVIAKLMGLEELPENDDSKIITKKESNSREKLERTVTKKTAEGSAIHERKTKDTGNFGSPNRNYKQIQPDQVTKDTMHGLQAEKNLENHQASFEETIHDKKAPQKDVEGTKPMRSSNKANMKIDKQQNNRNQSGRSIGNRKEIQEKERKQDDSKLREQKGKGKGERKEMKLKNQLQQMTLQKQNTLEPPITLKGQAEYNLTTLKTERRDAHMLPPCNEPKSLNSHALQQPQMHQNFESQKHYAGESEQHSDKQKIEKQIQSESRSLPKTTNESVNFPQKHPHTSQPRPSNESSTESIGAIQSTRVPSQRHHGNLIQDMSSPPSNENMQHYLHRNSSNNSSPRNLNSELVKEQQRAIISPDMEEEPTRIPSEQKVKVSKVQKPEAPRKIDELVARKSGNPHNSSKTMKHQTSILQEVKQRKQYRISRIKEEEPVRSSRSAEAHILKCNRSLLSTQQSRNLEELQSQAKEPSNLRSPPVNDECQSLIVPEILAPKENPPRINNQQGQDYDFGIDKLSSHSSVLDTLGRIHGAQLKNNKASVLETIEPLTESENHLKQILIKTHLFLNTAEALFKLNIPFDILHAGDGHDCHDEESKLLLDCGYEVMKRKGKRQELNIHPFMRISIVCLKVISLDDLVKQLHKDFEKLKFYGRNGREECVIEDYLPKMLENDVYSKDPDVNCMWDIGWHEMMFTCIEKDDIIRGVEKHLLNGLLDEVTRDLLVLFSSN